MGKCALGSAFDVCYQGESWKETEEGAATCSFRNSQEEMEFSEVLLVKSTARFSVAYALGKSS